MTATVTAALPHTRRKVLAFLRAYITEHGYPPAVREIGRHLYLGASTVQYQLTKLEEAGRIRRVPGRARAIELLNPEDGSTT